VSELPLIGCALSEEQLAERRGRIRRLQADVVALHAAPQRVEVEFAAGVDAAAVTDLVEAERECCSFFEFDWDRDGRRLAIAIPEPRFRPTLEALAGELTP
jgi:hypothetical protein